MPGSSQTIYTHRRDFSERLYSTGGLIYAWVAGQCALGEATASETCVVALASLPRHPTYLKDNGLRLRSSRVLRCGAQLCRAPAGGGVVTQLDAPRVTVPRPPGAPLPQFKGADCASSPLGGWGAVGYGRQCSALPSQARSPWYPPQRLVASESYPLLGKRPRAAGTEGQVRGGSFLAKMVARARVRVGITITLLPHC